MLDNFGNIGKWLEFDENTIKVLTHPTL